METKFSSLFAGLERAHGTYEIKDSRADGKLTGKAITVRENVTLQHWKDHLSGVKGLGIIPINDDSKVKFGAIDVDEYAELDLKKLSKGKSKFRVIGNLPYNLSSKIMLWTFKNSTQIIDIHYMFQKEFGQRLVSTPGKKTYGRLSVLTQYMFSSRELFTILPESFTPVPSVESVFIRLQPKPKKDINSLPVSKSL